MMNGSKSFLITNKIRPPPKLSSSSSSGRIFTKTNSSLKSNGSQQLFHSIHKPPPSTIKMRPSTTATGVRSSSHKGPGGRGFLSRPDTAPTGNRPPSRTNVNDVDAKTQISVLKSDIILLNQKMTTAARTEKTLDATLQNYQYKAGCKTQNIDTKMALIDILFEKMNELQKDVLLKTQVDGQANLAAKIQAKNQAQLGDSNLSKLTNYFHFIDHVMHMHTELKRKKKAKMPTIHKPNLVTMIGPAKDSSKKKKKSSSHYKEELKKLKKEYLAENKKLQSKLKKSETNYSILKDETTQEIKSLKDELKMLNTTKQIDDLDNESAKIQETYNALQAQYEKLSKDHSKMTTSYDKLREDHDNLLKKYNKLEKAQSIESAGKKTITTLTNQLTTIQQENKKLLKENKNLKQENTRLQKDLKAIGDIEKNYQKEQSKWTSEKQKLEKELETLKNKIKNLESEQANMGDLKALQLESSQKSRENEQLKNEIERLKVEYNNLETTSNDRIHTLEQELKLLKEAQANLEKAHEELTHSRAGDAGELKRLRDIEIQYEHMKPELQRLLNMQSAEEEESLARLAKMQAYLEQVESAYAKLQKETSLLKQRLASLETSEQLYKDAMEELRLEREKRIELEKQAKMISRVKRLNEKVMKAEELLRDRDAALHLANQSLEEERTMSAKLKRDVRRLLDDISSKDAQIQRLSEVQKQVARDSLSNSLTTQPSNHEVLIDEVRALREAFQAKLKAALNQVEQLKHQHAAKLLSIQEAVSAERDAHASQLKNLQQRCDILTQRVKEACTI